MQPSIRRLLPWALRAAGAAALVAAVASCSRYPFDDAFIHLRVARNLAFSGEPWFNLGERVMGSSSPLWLALLAGLSRLSGSADRSLAVGLALASIVFLFLATDAFLRAATRTADWVAVCLAFLLTWSLAVVSTGFLMETALALALGVTGLLLILRHRPAAGGVALGLAVATRYELILLAGLVVLLSPARRRVLLGLVPVGAIEAALLWIGYRALVPNTMGAKEVVYQIDWGSFLQAIPSRDGHGLTAILGLLLGAAALGAIAAWRGEDRELAALPGAACLLVASYVLRRSFVFDWYWPLVTYPIALTAITLVLATQGGLRILAVAAGVVVAYPILPQAEAQMDAIDGAIHRDPRAGAVANLRTATYARIGAALGQVCPGAVVMAPEIGALGWAYPGPILDAVGLVSPQVLRFHPLAVPDERPNGFVGAVPTRAVEELRPDAVVTMDVFATDALRRMRTGAGLRDYSEVAALPVFDRSLDAAVPDSLWGSTRTRVLARRGGPCDQREALALALSRVSPAQALSRPAAR